MAKFRLILQVFNSDGEVVFVDGVDAGTNHRPSMISKKHFDEAVAELEGKVNDFRLGTRFIADFGSETEIFTIGEELLVKLARALIEQFRPDLKDRNLSHYMTIKDMQKEVIKKTTMDIVFSKEKKK